MNSGLTPASVTFLEELAIYVHPYPKIKQSACRAGFADQQKKLSKKQFLLDVSRTIEF